MDFALQPHLYQNVPVIYWPWVFWQLFKIALWCELTEREVMVAVAETGHVYVTRIGDDPNRWSPTPYPHAHEYSLSTRLPGESRDQWRSRIEAAYAPGFGVQAWIISPRALGEVVSEFCFPERPTIRDPVPQHQTPPTPVKTGVQRPILSSCHTRYFCPWIPTFVGIYGP